MTTHLGHGGSRYDSMAEAKASYRLVELGFMRSNEKFSQTFSDCEGTQFRACPDFHHARYGLHLEFKPAALNGVKSKATSESQLASKRLRRGGFTIMKDNLDFGWNHSKRKQAIVQAAMTPDRFIVCFAKPPTFKEALDYWCAGVVFCTLASLPSYLASIRLKQIGLSVTFQLNYTTEEEGLTVFTDAPYLGKAARVVSRA